MNFPLKSECEKYDALYESGYGNCLPKGNFREYLARWVRDRLSLERPSIVDLGCGKGHLLKYVPYSEYTGIDISAHQVLESRETHGSDTVRFRQGSLHREVFGHYDVAYCIEVLEHIPEDFVNQTLDNILTCADTVILSISCVPANGTGVDGSVLHLTVREPKWWLEKIASRIDIKDHYIIANERIILFCGDNYMPKKLKLPDGCVTVRTLGNGEMFIPRRHPQTEAWMDENFERLPRQLRWQEKPKKIRKPKTTLKAPASSSDDTPQPSQPHHPTPDAPEESQPGASSPTPQD